MRSIINDLIEEIKYFISKKTIDAIIPPLIFVIINDNYNLYVAVTAALIIALSLGLLRFNKNNPFIYALSGFVGVIIASLFAILAKEATNYFIPGMIMYIFFIIIILGSLLIKKPLLAWASHLARGWDINWYWRSDVRPAYTEVTIFVLVYLIIRFTIIFSLFLQKDLKGLFWFKSILGLPLNIAAISISYIYGIYRLRNLGGPGILEYKKNINPPWEGQKKGF